MGRLELPRDPGRVCHHEMVDREEDDACLLMTNLLGRWSASAPRSSARKTGRSLLES